MSPTAMVASTLGDDVRPKRSPASPYLPVRQVPLTCAQHPVGQWAHGISHEKEDDMAHFPEGFL